MDLLLTHNYQLIKKLTRLQQAGAENNEMQKILIDSTKNTVEILRFLEQSGVSPEEINLAKEECASKMTIHIRNKQGILIPAVEYFIQIYIKLMQDKVAKVYYSE